MNKGGKEVAQMKIQKPVKVVDLKKRACACCCGCGFLAGSGNGGGSKGHLSQDAMSMIAN
jgi:hypothetical protein